MTQGILEYTCPFCGNLLVRKYGEVRLSNTGVYSVFFCERCAIGVTLPAPSAAELDSLYSSESYRTASGVRFNKLLERLIFQFRLGRRRRIEHFIRKGRILDIGCGRGLFLALMRMGGWEAAGTEFNEETASYASRAYGIEVKSGVPSEWGFPDESFDVVTIHHALEHVPDPAGMIDACRRLLRKDGLLVIAVPNIAGLQAVFGKGEWFHLDVPYHLYHFSEHGLAELLKRHSFSVVRTRRFDLEQGPFGWLQTLMNRSGTGRNRMYDFLKKPVLRNRGQEGTLKTVVVYTYILLLLPLYVPLSFALSFAESFIMKRGGTVEVYAVKKE